MSNGWRAGAVTVALSTTADRDMRVLPIVTTVISALLIGAHFLRSGSYWIAAAAVLFPAILVFRHRAAVWFVQALLLVAAVEWLRTIAIIALERQAYGQPWSRAAAVLGAVAALSVASAFLLGRACQPPAVQAGKQKREQRALQRESV
jgi:hypothetical protein